MKKRFGFALSKPKGFTLVEILVTVSIIAILAGIGLATYTNAQKKARDARRQADIETVRSALEIYRADTPAGYPSTNYSGLSVLVSQKYLSALPSDPGSNSYTYSGGGATYSLCATLEVLTPPHYCLTPP